MGENNATLVPADLEIVMSVRGGHTPTPDILYQCDECGGACTESCESCIIDH